MKKMESSNSEKEKEKEEEEEEEEKGNNGVDNNNTKTRNYNEREIKFIDSSWDKNGEKDDIKRLESGNSIDELMDIRLDKSLFWSECIFSLPEEVYGPGCRVRELGQLEKLLSKPPLWIEMIEIECKKSFEAAFLEVGSSNMQAADYSNIAKDISRTLSGFEFDYDFGRCLSAIEKAKIEVSLGKVLNAISIVHGNYCQGMNFIIAFLLSEGCTELESFIIFSYIIGNLHFELFFNSTSSALYEYSKILNEMMQENCPNVYNHFLDNDIETCIFTLEWYTTLFTLNIPRQIVCRFIDLLLLGIDDVPLRLAIALMISSELKLLKMNSEQLLLEFKDVLRNVGPPQTIIQETLKVNCPEGSNRLRSLKISMEYMNKYNMSNTEADEFTTNRFTASSINEITDYFNLSSEIEKNYKQP